MGNVKLKFDGTYFIEKDWNFLKELGIKKHSFGIKLDKCEIKTGNYGMIICKNINNIMWYKRILDWRNLSVKEVNRALISQSWRVGKF